MSARRRSRTSSSRATCGRGPITSSPQLTFYHLATAIGLYEDARTARGAGFDLRTFMDGMMEMGPVPVARYRERMLRLK